MNTFQTIIMEIIIFGISYLPFQFLSLEVDEFVVVTNLFIVMPFKILMTILCCFSIFIKNKRGQDQLDLIEAIIAGSFFFLYNEAIIFTIIVTYCIVNYLIPEGDYLDLLMLWIKRMMTRGFYFSLITIIICFTIFFGLLPSLSQKYPFTHESVLHYQCALYSVLYSYLFVFVFGINFYIWFIINGIRYMISCENIQY
ncbi:hypothetical protein H012_gp857 [Acanthamoeba polyphaga moumouvirus]|uniref:Uncharacterized protein n=2 Tax=Moumouvirus TaxID=3080801 RepID=L7RB29_9VIRU|nr:hypothetical protein H012_gp857 [Acanthamoeba polyphaga moumouvirus]AEX63261.1 hypothetical protein mv_L1059 [Moumouvirus Monve]AGC01609.1 hypothetical protein Moumou_00061 [Acanthamoeba polyphaga moumouvirus]AQN67933.1 hypothetical protein [Saudi moumouvirus]